MNGGYDDGYSQCDCFWGIEPGSFVKRLPSYLGAVQDLRVLDAGCGEGKNAAFMAGLGAAVDAIDISDLAVRNGSRKWYGESRINWLCGDLRHIVLKPDIMMSSSRMGCFIACQAARTYSKCWDTFRQQLHAPD